MPQRRPAAHPQSEGALVAEVVELGGPLLVAGDHEPSAERRDGGQVGLRVGPFAAQPVSGGAAVAEAREAVSSGEHGERVSTGPYRRSQPPAASSPGSTIRVEGRADPALSVRAVLPRAGPPPGHTALPAPTGTPR